MRTAKRNSFRGGPKTIKRTSDTRGDYYPANKFPSKTDDSWEERSERSERKPRPGARPYGFEKREREPMHVFRRPSPSERSAMPETARGTVAPGSSSQPIPTYKFKKGFGAAKAEITEMIDEIAGVLSSGRNVKEIEIAISFSADGTFMGFGAGGSATIKIRLAPSDL
jgi:hypothetical protein